MKHLEQSGGHKIISVPGRDDLACFISPLPYFSHFTFREGNGARSPHCVFFPRVMITHVPSHNLRPAPGPQLLRICCL